MSYEEQAKLYGISLDELIEMHRENSEWWENEVINESKREHVSSVYGESCGGASFYRLTATDPVNGNVETKDIVSATLSSEQLV